MLINEVSSFSAEHDSMEGFSFLQETSHCVAYKIDRKAAVSTKRPSGNDKGKAAPITSYNHEFFLFTLKSRRFNGKRA